MSTETPLPFAALFEREQEIAELKRQIEENRQHIAELEQQPVRNLGGYLWLSGWEPTGKPS